MVVFVFVFANTIHITKPVSEQTLVFMCLQCKSFENSLGKGEIAISPFPTVFFTQLENFSSNLKLSSASSFSLEESKICHLGMG